MVEMIKYIVVGIISVVLSCVSQMLLKVSANKKWNTRVREYLNMFVISAYFLLGACMLLTIYMYRGMEFKYGAIIESLSYVIIMIMGKLFFDEPFTQKKILGNVLIILGIFIFNI